MVKLKNSFQRKEKKYSLSTNVYFELKEKLENYMEEDSYGLHTIISIYFDTVDYEMIRHSINKPAYKEKFRVRSYGIPQENTSVFLEIKKKFNGVVYKRRMDLPFSLANEYTKHPKTFKFVKGNNQQIKQEIDWLFARKKLEPKVMIAYDRRAFLDLEDENFRITFDFNIRYKKVNELQNITDTGEKVAPEIDVLMEVKALGAYPLWFSEILASLEIYPVSFSKYAQTYQRYLYCEEDFRYVV